MSIPLTTTFRRIRNTTALETQIRARLDRLGTFGQPILGGRVLVELGERHHRTGNRCHVRINLALPGETLVIEHRPSGRPTARAIGARKSLKRDELVREHTRAKLAIRDAFDAARRRLQDRQRRRRGDVKTHASPAAG